ncbi:hypothetical protein SAMN02745146_1195 [Hymenobacter daecheongensis DSM 21074]|uniref:DUF3108 domain-containing protein n=1 Tax=Hymenobacter daecheongensis DSM 21074 TaxID=1121955 RepID=A0A1M6CM99_9BACT|nr:hypothetical protein [Hymenobacter daecheongensis]SHI61838.1 hypothetical protein SAMN02745146_1195 [Hymenobacter daecheongensis DSM 21074]
MLVLLISAFYLSTASAPDSLVIFSAQRTYHYRAVYISPTGDTLSRERITMQPSGQPWVGQPKRQSACTVQYSYRPADSLTFSARPNPQTQDVRKPYAWQWQYSTVTGVIENPQEIWIHPFRSNQYAYTEVAPFPQVKPALLHPGKSWRGGRLFIMGGWGAFKGSVQPTYHVKAPATRRYGKQDLSGCWLIEAVGQHSRLGTSYLDFYFHPRYGFTEVHYRFYDGTRISFVLEQLDTAS